MERDFLDRHFAAPEHHGIADRDGGQIGHVDRDHVHRDAADQRRPTAVDLHRRT